MGSVRLERARDRPDRGSPACARSDFQARLYPLAGGRGILGGGRPGRRVVCLRNERVAAAVEQVWGRSASSGLATGRTGGHRRVLAQTFRPDFIHWRGAGESWAGGGRGAGWSV